MSRTEQEDPTRAIARAVLYGAPAPGGPDPEGREAALSGVYPRAWTESGHPDDACAMRAECLVELPRDTDGPARVDVRVRFLQAVERRVAVPEGEWLRFVAELELEGRRYEAWEEAAERELTLEGLEVHQPDERRRRISLTPGAETEWLTDAKGRLAGALVRSWSGLCAEVSARSELVGRHLSRVSVVVTNESRAPGEELGSALRCSLLSTHLALHTEGGRFVSLNEPPGGLREAAEECHNEGCWPVLVGNRELRVDLLASPVELADFPQVRPARREGDGGGGESPLLLKLRRATEEGANVPGGGGVRG